MKIFLIIALLSSVIGAGTQFWIKKKANPYLEWLDKAGIVRLKTAPEQAHIGKWIQKHGHAEIYLSNYLISAKFCEKITDILEQEEMVSRERLQKICLEAAPQFCVKYTGVLLEFLHQKEMLFPFFSPMEECYYIFADVIKEYERLFGEE